MSLEEIIHSIRLWNDRKNDPEYLNELFSRNDCFDVHFQEINHSENEAVHACLGILDDEVVLFVIHTDRDTKDQANSGEGILPHIEIGRKLTGGYDEPIPDEVAELRILNWQEHHSAWVSDVIAANGEIHSAFSIPTKGMEQGRQYRMFFALKASENSQGTSFVADLVLWDFEENTLIHPNQTIGFHDTVRLCPPFGNAEFHLIKSATSD